MNTERRAALRHLNAFLHECPAEAEAGARARLTCFSTLMRVNRFCSRSRYCRTLSETVQSPYDTVAVCGTSTPASLHECPAEAEAGAWVRITCFYEPRL